MVATLSSLSPAEAWQPLPASQWDEGCARHLLLRIGWSATPAETARALTDGPLVTLKRYFAGMPAFAKPPLVAKLEADGPELARKSSRGTEMERRAGRREARERSRDALAELTIAWLQHAADVRHAPAEKWLLFLQDVWVVGVEKVRNTALIFHYQDVLRRAALSNAPTLAKAMSRCPAMIAYLDLQQSKAAAPNENFARELFELFTLGEGNYTETDIKEAARAFTGYRQQLGRFSFVPRQHDGGVKTVFGETGRFDGDNVIDLIFRQQAAGPFLVRELARFYLAHEPLPAAHTDALGAWWAQQGYRYGPLLAAFFCSRAFYAPEFRGNYIKSPLQFYLGLMQDLEIAPPPLPRRVIGGLRLMGQTPFNPPNVRGWVGGRTWINSATLSARRAAINAALNPLNEELLNGDERAALRHAGGSRAFAFPPERFDAWAAEPSTAAAAALLTLALPGRRHDAQLQQQLADYLEGERSRARPRTAVRTALATLLESPDYHLC